jgi:hypothetical protein
MSVRKVILGITAAAALFNHLYESTRTQFGFSPLQSLHIELSAAEAARALKASVTRLRHRTTKKPRAMPGL